MSNVYDIIIPVEGTAQFGVTADSPEEAIEIAVTKIKHWPIAEVQITYKYPIVAHVSGVRPQIKSDDLRGWLAAENLSSLYEEAADLILGFSYTFEAYRMRMPEHSKESLIFKVYIPGRGNRGRL
jgi:hypothetical protein